eukprot:TRINITY_DN1644_c0_g1_i3.p1 TRINITY_DN1644_c0_g1~~TRINITY_DN1644_c0_g1_i3.p1  ORF type:complete len:143 (-),score=18.95 TRINITY_DN1644_c0_g1_i3:223-651(-)
MIPAINKTATPATIKLMGSSIVSPATIKPRTPIIRTSKRTAHPPALKKNLGSMIFFNKSIGFKSFKALSFSKPSPTVSLTLSTTSSTLSLISSTLSFTASTLSSTFSFKSSALSLASATSSSALSSALSTAVETVSARSPYK